MKFFLTGILVSEGGSSMGIKGWAITAGLGAAAGAVAIMMLPQKCAARKLAAKAADKVENTAYKVSDAISSKLDM
jgi:hypothetical protein